MEIDRLLVQDHRCAEAVDLADDALLAAGLVDDDHVVRRRGAQRHPLGRKGLRGPVVPPFRFVEDALLVEVGEDARRVLGSEPLAALEWNLEGAALEVLHQDVQIVGVHKPSLR